MNKKNFPIFISLLIVSLFFTVVFYFAYTNVRSRYESYMTYSFSHGELEGDISDEDIEKIKTIEGVDFVGKMSLNPDPSKYRDDLIVLNYQDADINKMKEYSNLIEGRFSEKEDEIVLSKRFVDKNSFKLGDKISLDIGKRVLNGEEIGPTSAYSDRENFQRNETKTFVIVGIYEDVYNSYSRLNYGLSQKNKMDNFRTFIKFSSFEESYEHRLEIQREINEKTGKNIELVLDDDLISYYGLERPFIQILLSKAVIVLSIIGCVALFIFFVKNIFLVWGLRKIRELSIFKSIGSTDFQIYLSLLKEGIFISLLPIVLGHILGYGFVYYLFIAVQKNQDISNVKYVSFNPILSFIVILVSLIVVVLAIMVPARKISKINIIDGIRENVDFSKSKKKKDQDLWKELRLNNVASIKSQRYISSVGIIIISVFIIVIGISKYNRDYSYYDTGYNFGVDYYSNIEDVPPVLEKIIEKVPNEKTYIFKEKYVQIKNDLDLSKEAINAGLKKEIEEDLKKYGKDYYNGSIIALREKDLEILGGKKGEFVLYNMVQEDSRTPLSKGKMIPFFNSPSKVNIVGEDQIIEVKISKTISDLGIFKSKTYPFVIKIYTDFDTYFKLMDDLKSETYNNYPFELKMDIAEEETDNTKEYVESLIRGEISQDDKFNIRTEKELNENQAADLKTLGQISLAIGLIIFILNVTNGYSSINLSLMSRKKEIGSLYSCGMDLDELNITYKKEFISEQIKSFVLAILISLGVMVVISIFSSSLTMKTLLIYYDYKLLLGFSVIVYGVDFLIYHFSLKRILNKPTIELIRVI